MSIEIIKAGLQSSIQDTGRSGWRHLGITCSGAMDPISAKLVNRILGVPDNQAVLEMTQTGVEMHIDEDIDIALAGANMIFTLNGSEVSYGKVISLRPGDQLIYQNTLSGFRTYMGFSKALQLEQFLGSHATQLNAGLGGFEGRQLKPGDELQFEDSSLEGTRLALMTLPEYLGHYQLRYSKAPETDNFSASQLGCFEQTSYTVRTELNRMGIRLTGSAVMFSDYPHMASRGLLPGAIQIPPDGLPIIAGMDCQTTGGYLRIGQIIQADLPVVGQLKPGDQISFLQVNLTTAERIYHEQQQLLAK